MRFPAAVVGVQVARRSPGHRTDGPGPAAVRRIFKERLPVDAATWTRGRGWAIWKAMKVLVGALDDDPQDAAFTTRVIGKILTDHLADT
jgi:hypothetical protein